MPPLSAPLPAGSSTQGKVFSVEFVSVGEIIDLLFVLICHVLVGDDIIVPFDLLNTEYVIEVAPFVSVPMSPIVASPYVIYIN